MVAALVQDSSWGEGESEMKIWSGFRRKEEGRPAAQAEPRHHLLADHCDAYGRCTRKRTPLDDWQPHGQTARAVGWLVESPTEAASLLTLTGHLSCQHNGYRDGTAMQK